MRQIRSAFGFLIALLCSGTLLVGTGCNNESTTLTSPGQSRTGTNLTPPPILAREGIIDLVIYDGQGGAPVPSEKEETVGGFTVANLNDTDGNGVVDADQSTVASEVDLMRLDVLADGLRPNAVLTLELTSGPVRVWEQSTKDTEVPFVDGQISLPFNTLPRTLWVEGTAPSNNLRDIVITLYFRDLGDIVKATAIWADVEAAAYETQDAASLLSDATWSGMPTPPRDQIIDLGGVGIRPSSPDYGIRNVIAIKFRARPNGLNGVAKVRFDGTRQIEGNAWRLSNTTPTCTPLAGETFTFPAQDGLPNDDMNPFDKSQLLNQIDEYFDVDSPGKGNLNCTTFPNGLLQKFNAKEFLRVRLDGIRPSGNSVDGSRCSPKWYWHQLNEIGAQSGVCERQTGDIGPGHIAITCPN